MSHSLSAGSHKFDDDFNGYGWNKPLYNLGLLSIDDQDTLHTHEVATPSFAKAPPGGGTGGGGTGGGTVVSSYTSGGTAAGHYNIEISFKGTWTASLQKAFIDNANFLSSIIQGDEANVFYRGNAIDDIHIDASLATIDGQGGILGQAGATIVRTADYLPVMAQMQFDKADAANYNSLGLWKDIVLHEMIHCLGFSDNIWSNKGLISGAGTANPLFTGTNAADAYETLFGILNPAGVPLEQDGGPGTRDSHWDEQTFGNELMTGYINQTNYLSNMTIASLEDLGYDTIWS